MCICVCVCVCVCACHSIRSGGNEKPTSSNTSIQSLQFLPSLASWRRIADLRRPIRMDASQVGPLQLREEGAAQGS